MAEFKLSRFKYTWDGEWAPRARYNPDQIVSFGGKVYVSLESHTANTNFYADLEYYNNDTPPLLVPKWELVADGVSWKGDWANSTYYVLGDTVKYGGTVYLCINAHTSSPAQILDVDGNVVSSPGPAAFALDSINWVIQLPSTDWKIDWLPNTYYKINDVVRYGGRVYRANSSHLSSSDIAGGLEANQSSWDVVSIADDWKGVWIIGTRYKVNDIVKFGGNVYVCAVPHTSNSSTINGLPADQAKWNLLHQGIEYRNDWTANTLYKENDIVKYGSYIYKALTFHNGGVTFEPTNWVVFCPGQEYDVIWTTTTVYQTGDIVSYGGNLYSATDLNAGRNPSTDAVWQLLFQNSRIRGDWTQVDLYKIGDVVRRGGNVYLAHKDSSSQDPDITNDGSTTNEEYWDLVIPGMRWRGVWSEGETYIVGDTVVWVASSYRCLDKHVADQGNRPDDDTLIGMGTEPTPPNDSTLEGRYWAKITDGNKINRLKNVGDIRTFGPGIDGSTIGYKALEVGTQGLALTSLSGVAAWDPLQSTAKAYYVAEFGEDIATAGTSPQNPWRTVRYACENITGYATIFVRTGVYDEVLPIRVPAFVAIVGDELRSTVIQPADTLLTADYIARVLAAAEYIKDLAAFVVKEIAIGDPVAAQGTVVYGLIPQNFSGTPATDNETLIVASLLDQFQTRLSTGNALSINGQNTQSADVARLNARDQIMQNRAFLKNETTLYIDAEFNDSTGALGSESPRWDADLERIFDAVIYDMLYVGNYKTIEAATYFLCASNYTTNKLQNMFLMRDGTGLRNCTLRGLEGTLGAINIYGTRRPTAGAFVSLDPGWGVGDTAAWVGTKSPYIQNVTTFGTACVGLKIDGNLHAGGNQTIVCNDFTQILSDGIGVWANGTGRTECVSIFTYYNHIGYLSTTGGRIRGTNGNNSYGTYGSVSEGYNIAETPIVATVNNRYYEASVLQTLANDGVAGTGLQKLFYSHAGNNYTSATANIVAAGSGANLVFDDFRDGAVSEIRITNRGDSSAEGGGGYVFAANTGQSGDTTFIQLAGSDTNDAATYKGMRAVIMSGDGTGQYGYIVDYVFASKTAYIGLERQPEVSAGQTFNAAAGNQILLTSVAHLTIGDPIMFTGIKFGNIQDYTVYYVRTIDTIANKITISALANLSTTFGLVNGSPVGVNPAMTVHCIGWQHFVEGTPILATLNNTSNYYVEPRLTFSSPGFTTSNTTLPALRQWSSIAGSNSIYVAVALDSAASGYTVDGTTWLPGTMPTQALWTKVKYVGGTFIAFATGGQAARSTDGISWSSMTMSATAEWRDVAYGVVSGVGTWVAVAAGGFRAAISTDGTTWAAFNLPEGAEWNSVAFGKGKFVATALSDSSTGAAVAYTNAAATTWTLGSIAQGSYSLAYGNNRFVALSGGYAGATEVSTSFDGITWTETVIQAQDWRHVIYAQGLFVAIATGTAVAATSVDGKVWNYQTLGSSGPWCSIAFGNVSTPGKFIVLGGLTSNSTAGRIINTGKTAQGRCKVVAGRISAFSLWDTGSGYTSAPALVLTDPNNTSEVSTGVRISNGVLGPPTIATAGTGYETIGTTTTITGNGYKDEYQIGTNLVISGLTRLPGPGDNIAIGGINDYTYKLLTCEILSGALPNATARLSIAKDLGREESPDHGTTVEIRQQYSQVRLTGHDFLDIGLGNFTQTNYPQTLFPNGTVLAPEDEIRESNGGRVFYTSTDQDGNFRVGELFAVEQSTGTVTLNAQFFALQGLEELRLGGVTVGGSGVVIREFSTDGTFTADSNNIVPTQKAIKAYLQRRVSGGGADAITGQLTAGIVRLGPDTIATTTGEELIFGTKVVFNGGIDGTWLALNYFTSSGG
jgi:hypothetical protein